MRGRFFSYAFLISTILIAFQTWNLKNSKLRNVLIAAVFLYSLFYPHTPLNSPLDYHNDHIVNGIADERGYYFPYLAFNRYVASRLTKTQFPQHFLCEEGKRAPLISVSSEVGMYGYCAGLDHIIIDPLALTDPFLARIPVTGDWRIGHFYRDIPQGYAESLAHGQALIVDPELNDLYKTLVIITQSEELLHPTRLRAIFLMNLGVNASIAGDL
jgi:arabinofuranosyltransferase